MAETPNPAPAEALRSELHDIATNPANPRHAGYQKNDPGVMRYLDERYKAVHGTGQTQLSEGLSVGGPEAQQEHDAATAEYQKETWPQVESQLRQEWGGDYDGNLALVRSTAAGLFPGPAGQVMLERLAGAFAEAGGSDVEAIKLLLNIGQRMRGRR